MYGWCDNGHPKVIVPLTEQDGTLVVTEKPAGIAVYDGTAGTLDIRSTGDGIPGPTYPLSLAARQRESTPAMGNLWDYLFRRVGWELPDEESTINAGNASEFTLTTADKRSELYVAPETPRGSAVAISALTVVEANLRKSGERAPLVVHRTNPTWQSPNAIIDRVRSDFGDVFAVNRDAGIFELAPTDEQHWVATIGQKQNLLYRVVGDGALKDNPCLKDLAGRVIRCGRVTNMGAAGPGVAIGGNPAPTAVPPDQDVSALSNQQLVDLINRANAEMARRLGNGP